MNRTEAEAQAKLLVAGTPAANAAAADWSLALDRAATFDQLGLAPDAAAWTPSFDPHWAAAEVLTLLAVRAQTTGQLVRFTSEGATFEQAPADLFGAAHNLREMSQTAAVQRALNSGLGTIEIQGGVGFLPTSQQAPADLDWS